MSEARVDLLSNRAGNGPANLRGQWASKSWVHFNGTGTVAIGDSENTSSITDNGAGNYTQNFTTGFANTNFASLGTGTDNVNSFQIGVSNYARTSGSTSMRGQSSNHGGYDSIFTSYVNYGDLA